MAEPRIGTLGVRMRLTYGYQATAANGGARVDEVIWLAGRRGVVAN